MADSMRIMALDPAGNLWGSERVLLDFLGARATAGHCVALCCPPNSPLAGKVQRTGIRVFPSFQANLHNRGKGARLWAMLGLLGACIRHRSQLIYVNQAGASRIAVAVGGLLRLPVVPHVRLREDVEYIESLNAVAGRMPEIIAISNFIGGAFTRPEIKSRVRVLYDAFAPAAFGQEIVHGNGPRHLVCAGRLVPVKGQDLLATAAVELRRRGVGFSLDFLGEGIPGDHFGADLREIVGSEQGANVRFRGFVDNVVERMESAWAVVCPSRTEPLGRVVFEAWSAGSLPVAMAGSGGAAEVIAASGGGLLCDDMSAPALAETLMECLQMDSDDRRLMIERGRKWLHANTDCEQYSSRMLELFREALR